jgi:uncharacterized protein YndB with AHSA1/START domain
VGIQAPECAVYEALTSREGLSRWWTEETTTSKSAAGERIRFGFGRRGFFEMDVIECEAPRRVVWHVINGPEEWIGTRIDWQLEPDGDHTNVLFRHLGWREPVPFMHHCSTKWATFLMSLKALVETGAGAPFPNDIRISRNN